MDIENKAISVSAMQSADHTAFHTNGQQDVHTYEVCALGIHSAIPLSGVPAAASTRDVRIRRGTLADRANGSKVEGNRVSVSPQEVLLVYPHVGYVLMRKGTDIVIDVHPEASHEAVQSVLLGPCLAVILHQRQRLVLHASAVEMDGRAVVFLGDKGWGKSTMASAFWKRDHALITDDILCVEFDENRQPVAVPSVPHLKLWPDAIIESWDEDPQVFRQVYSESEKRLVYLDEQVTERIPLGCIYVLGVGDQIGVEQIRGHRSIIQLLRHSYLRMVIPASQTVTTNFRQCAVLAEQVPVLGLKRPLGLTHLPATVRAVASHFHNLQ